MTANLDFPIANLPLLGKWLWGPMQSLSGSNLTTLTPYSTLRKGIKRIFSTCCPHYEHLGLHSFRRGGTTEKINNGVHRDVVKHLGRWRSDKSFEGYIDDQTSARLCAEIVERLSSGRHSNESPTSPAVELKQCEVRKLSSAASKKPK